MQKGHLIANLPSDQNPASEEEQQILSMLLKKQYTTMEMIISSSKELLLIGCLFAVINTRQSEDFIKKHITLASRSDYSLLFFKTIIFTFLIFVIRNFHLIQKK
jgi:ABC-type antimicrobial peptide transport system permease subunit